MAKLCYNCGKILTKKIATVEHVPAKNLYEGFGDNFKKNRITVPACFECNNLYSKIDKELRDVLAVKNDNLIEKMELTGKGVRSILHNSNWMDRAHFNNNGEVIAVDFSYSDLRKFHIKNFKALFYKKYGFPLPDEFQVEIIADGDDDKISSAQILHDYIIDKEFEFSGHPDIFKYILKDITPDISKNSIFESGDFSKIIGIVGLLVYHDDVGAIVVAGKDEFVKGSRRN